MTQAHRPPPADALYEVLEYKAALVAEHGIDGAFEAFRAAYPNPPLELRTLPFRSARDRACENALAYTEFAEPGEAYVVEPPAICGEHDAHAFRGTSRASFVACYANAEVVGRSSLVVLADAALADFQDDERDRGGDREQLDAALLALAGDRAYLVLSAGEPARAIGEAFVALLAPQADAFGHWLWHQIPRFVAALELGGLPAMPVLVDAGLPQSHYDALRLAIGERAMPLAIVERGERVRVARAWYASTPFFVPYLPVYDARWSWSHMSAPPSRWRPILDAMGRSALTLGGARENGTHVYFARAAHLRRKLVNAAEIETIVRARGFEIVYAQEHSFADQVRIARDATHLIGPEGSAMFLSFYARPGAHVAILDHPHVAQLTNLSGPLATRDIDVTVLTGAVENANDAPGYPNFGFPHFADYRIEPAGFAAFLDAWAVRT